MTTIEKKAAIGLRRVFRIALGYKDKFETTSENCDYFDQAASDLIKEGIKSAEPFAVSRFGHSELRALLTYLQIRDERTNLPKLISFIKGENVEPWWSKNTLKLISHNAGVFPNDVEVIERFCRLILAEMKEIDILGSWLGGERWIKPLLPNTKFIRFHDFYHFLHAEPWTTSLKNRKVLVVHPFAKSIQRQYEIRDKIYSGVHTLPDFELITHPAVQSIAGNKPKGFDNWFQALDSMKQDFAAINFDIAILGCGAYGMPLAAFIKRDLKRKAIHLGGNTQILFGIAGNRWLNDPNFRRIFNSYWTRPLPEETPTGHHTIDSNCYW